MASHLSIISGPSASARAFAGQQAGAQDATSEPKGLLGLFAALLAGGDAQAIAANAPAGLASASSGQGGDNGLAGLFRVTLQNAIDGDLADGSTEDPSDPDALAAVIDAPVLATAVADPKPMVDFIEALGALKTSLDKGEPLDPALIEQVEAALGDLAEALGLDLETLPVPEDFAALLDSAATEESGLAGALTQLLAPVAQSLATAQSTTDADAVTDAPAVSTQLKALGDRLAALLSAIETGDIPAEQLAALGMTPGQPLDAEIEAALSRFAQTLAPAPVAVPDEPVLAAPALKLPEPSLIGKTADATTDASEPSATAAPVDTTERDDATNDQSDARSRNTADRDRSEPMARETRTNGAQGAPAAVDASNTPSPSAEAGTQPASTRIDAAANPRIVQAGYQTSQQQLNLPQIAFELARQVQDGNTRFQIRLDPPELGRIDVRLEIDQSGQVNARLVVEKSETLDLMQRDQRGLERALQQAGLDGAKTNLEFSLKQNPFSGQQGQMGDGKGQSDASNSANDNGLGNGEAEPAPPMVNLYRGALQASGVNIIA